MDGVQEALAVSQLPLVEAIGLLVEVAVEVERLDADVGTAEGALEQAPEVLQPVGVDPAVDVPDGVVDSLMRIVALQAVVARQVVAVEGGAGGGLWSGLRAGGYVSCGC